MLAVVAFVLERAQGHLGNRGQPGAEQAKQQAVRDDERRVALGGAHQGVGRGAYEHRAQGRTRRGALEPPQHRADDEHRLVAREIPLVDLAVVGDRVRHHGAHGHRKEAAREHRDADQDADEQPAHRGEAALVVGEQRRLRKRQQHRCGHVADGHGPAELGERRLVREVPSEHDVSQEKVQRRGGDADGLKDDDVRELVGNQRPHAVAVHEHARQQRHGRDRGVNDNLGHLVVDGPSVARGVLGLSRSAVQGVQHVLEHVPARGGVLRAAHEDHGRGE